MQKQSWWQDPRKGCATLFVGAVLFVSLWLLCPSPPLGPISVSVGNEGVLTGGYEGRVTLGVDEAALDDLVKAGVAKDTQGFMNVLSEGRGFTTAAGCRVLVIDMSPFTREVRLLDGESAGRTGWTAYENVAPAGSGQ